MKKFIISLVTICLVVLLSACGSNSAYDERLASIEERLNDIEERLSILEKMQIQTTLPQNSLIGTWKGEYYTYTFYSDETVTQKYDDGRESTHIYSTNGTYTLIIKYNEGHLGSIEYRYSIDGDTLTITGTSSRETFTRVK